MNNITVLSITIKGHPEIPVNPFARHVFVKQYFPISDILLLGNSLIGIIANCVAMFILSSSVKINKSSFYALLMNQSVADTISAMGMFVFIFTRNMISIRNLSTGLVDQLYCHLVFSGVAITGANCASSMNLSALSLERMACVVFPIRHRTGVYKGIGRILAALSWFFGIASIIPLSVVANGVNMEKGGICYFWNNYSSDIGAKVFTVLFTAFTFGIPLSIMIASFVLIYASLMKQQSVRNRVKLNVVKTLSTCVFLFFICNAPKSIFGLITQFGGPFITNHWLHPYSIIMMMSNVVVNPFVYSFQYSDYQTELKRQFYRMIGNKQKLYALNTIKKPQQSFNSNVSVKTITSS